jgi:hypothetical protein
MTFPIERPGDSTHGSNKLQGFVRGRIEDQRRRATEGNGRNTEKTETNSISLFRVSSVSVCGLSSVQFSISAGTSFGRTIMPRRRLARQ